MFLSKLFKRKSTKLLTLFGALAMALGAGAAASAVVSEQQNEVVETKALGNKYTITGNTDALANWTPADGPEMTISTVNNWCAVAFTFEADNQFKVTDGTWNNSWGSITDMTGNAVFGTQDGNIKINSNKGGTYTILFNGTTVYGLNGDQVAAIDKAGWVLAGSGTSFVGTAWTPGSAIKLGDGKDGNIAQLLDYSMSSGDQFRICYSDVYQLRDWKNWETTPAGFTKVGDNLQLTNSGSVDIYLNGSYNGVAEYHPIRTITYQYRSTDRETVTENTLIQVADGKSTALPNTPVSGYNFYGWYENYDSSTGIFSNWVNEGGASYTVTADKTLYGRYIKNGYGYVLGSWNNEHPCGASRLSDGPESGYKYFRRTFAVNDKFALFYCHESGKGSDGNWNWENKDASGDATNSFTNDSGKIKCTTAGSYDVLVDIVNGKVFLYHSSYVTVTGYYMSGTGTFGSPTNWAISTAVKMDLDPSGSNTAILENGSTGTPVDANSKFKVVNHVSAARNDWYNMTLGGSYSFATIDDNAVKITVAGSYNFYFKATSSTAGTIYIVDASEILNAGFFYISSPALKENITVTTTNTKDEHPFNGSSLDSVSGVELMSSTLKFNGGFVYEIPIYDLRGADSGSPCTSVTFSWSTPSSGSIALTAVNGSGVGGSAQRYYITGSGAATSSSIASLTEYVALKVAIDIDIAIKGTTHQSVCEVAKGTAESLCSRYDSASKTYMPNATILTWDGDNTVTKGTPVYSGDPVDVRLDSIRVELGNRAGGNYVIASASLIPGGSKGNESPLTTTLWIVLASGLAGLAAIGTAYFVSKKKRHQA